VNGANLALLEHPSPPVEIMTAVPKASPPAAILPADGQNGAATEPKAPAVNGQPMMMKGGPGG
jgi:hypothetical protein